MTEAKRTAIEEIKRILCEWEQTRVEGKFGGWEPSTADVANRIYNALKKGVKS